MRRIFEVDPRGYEDRIFVSRGTMHGDVEVIVAAGLLTLTTVIKTAAYRGAYDQRMNGRLRHVI